MSVRSLLTVPNGVSALRLALVLLLWAPALAAKTTLVAIGVAVAGATDVLDGIIARASRHRTRFGGQLDSVADLLLMASTLAWLLLLRPEFFRAHQILLATWVATALLTLLVGWMRHRRIGNLHLYSAKAAGALAYLFAIYLLAAGDYSRAAFYVVIVACFLASTEALLVFLVLPRHRDHEAPGSVLPLLRAALKRAG